jgi:Tfp pilus assembly protein PilO
MTSSPSRMTIDVLGSAACLSMIAAAYFFGVRGLLSGRALAANLISESAEVARENRTSRETEQAIESSLLAINQSLEAEGVTLASGTELTGRLIAIGTLAEQAGVVIETLTPKHIETGELFDRQPIALRCVGSYPDCVSLLKSIREDDPTVVARSVVIQRTSSDDLAALDVELVWFVRSEKTSE